jgi:hypothetical protein
VICPPCKEAADAFTDGNPPPHDPAICRDAAIQPHGCACQHGRSKEPLCMCGNPDNCTCGPEAGR